MRFLGSPWLPVGVLFAISFIARRLQGSWFAPSAFAGLLWSLYIAVPMVATEDHISAQTVWLITCLISCLQVGAFIFELPRDRRASESTAWRESLSAAGDKYLRLSLFLAGIALASVIVYAAIWLRSLGLGFSLQGFFSMGRLMYDILVGGEPDLWWYRLTRMWVFPSAILGGAAAALVKSRTRKLLSLTSFVPSLMMAISVASRLGTGLTIACWMCGYLSAKCYATRGHFRVGVRFATSVLLIACATVTIYAGLYALRGSDLAGVSDGSVMISSDLLSYLPVFDSWVSSGERHSLSLGAYSVGGLFELSGLKTRVRALNYEPVVLESGITSNIYTAFRGLIDDFSLPGSMFLLVIAGAFAGRAYTQLCSGHLSSMWMLAAYYVYLLWSPIMSAFYYNSVPLALLVAALVIRDSPKKSSLIMSAVSGGIFLESKGLAAGTREVRP